MNDYVPSIIRRACAQVMRRSKLKKPSLESSNTRHQRRANPRAEMLERRVMLSVTEQLTGVPVWVEQGPRAITNGQLGTGRAPANFVAGAIEAIAVSKDPKVMLVGSVNGGIWKTDTATNASPVWKVVSDQLPSLSISDLAYSPIAKLNQKVVFAGTGALSSLGATGGIDGLVYRSLDGGDTWSWISSLGNTVDAQLPISSIVPLDFSKVSGTATQERDSEVVLAGTSPAFRGADGGMFRSVDGGRTWTQVSGAAGTGLPRGPITSIVADVENSKRVYAALSGDFTGAAGLFNIDKGVYESTDAGETWHRFTTDNIYSTSKRILLADSSNGTVTVVYAAVFDTSNQLAVLGKLGSDSNFSPIATNSAELQKIANVAGSFSVIHLSLTARPNNLDEVYIAGQGDNEVFQGNRTAGTWTLISASGANNTAPHADSRRLAFDATGQDLFDLDDGGIYRFTAHGGQQWTSMDGTLGITEIHLNVQYDPFNQVIVAGTQDDGSIEQSKKDSQVWSNVLGGDGNYQLVVPDKTLAGKDVVTRYNLANDYGGFFTCDSSGCKPDPSGTFSSSFQRRQFDLSNNVLNSNDVLMLSPTSTLLTARALNGIANVPSGYTFLPYVANAADSAELLIANTDLYDSPDRGDHVTRIPIAGDNRSAFFSALVFGFNDPSGALTTANIFYAAKGNAIISGTRAGKGAAWTTNRIVVPGAGIIADIVIDPTNPLFALAVDTQSNVFMTITGGTLAGSWVAVKSNLSQTQSQTRSIEVLMNAGVRTILVGGNFGVFRTHANNIANVFGGGETLMWDQFGANLPNAIVTDLHYIPQTTIPGTTTKVGDILLASTLGRGAWTISNAATAINTDSVLTLTGGSTDDVVTLARNPDNILLLQVSVDGIPLTTYSELPGNTQLPVNAVQKIVFNGGDGKDELLVDESNGLITNPGTITFNGQTGTGDTLGFSGSIAGLIQPKGPNAPNGPYIHNDTVLGQPRAQTIIATNITKFDPKGTAAQAQIVNTTVKSLVAIANATAKNIRKFSQQLPGLSRGLPSAINGRKPKTEPIGADSGATQDPDELLSDTLFEDGEGLLSRLLEEGAKPLDLTQIGTTINDFDSLRQALDDLDATPSNVTFTQNGTTTRFDMTVNLTLDGTTNLDVSALGGSLQLGGDANIKFDVHAHVVFGFDDNGFFIDPNGPKDVNGAPEPEFTLNNFKGDVKGEGQVGFLEVSLKNGKFTADPAVKYVIDLVNPGTDANTGADDGLIRMDEANGNLDSIATTTLTGNGSGDDVTVSGDFTVGAVLPGGSEPFTLASANIAITWADVNDLNTVTLKPGVGAAAGAQQLINFVQTTAAQIGSGLHSIADFLQTVGGKDLLGTKIPLLNKSLSDVLGQLPAPVVFDGAVAPSPISQVGPVSLDGGQNKFVVQVVGVNLLTQGISIGDSVDYAGGSGTFTGQIDSVEASQFVVRFASSLTQNPSTTNPKFTIHIRGGLEKQLDSALGELNDLTNISVRIPTLQEMIRTLARAAGINADQIPLSFDSTNSAVIFSPTFKLDPLKFSEPFDLGTTIAGFKLSTSGNFNFTVTPTFKLSVGISLDPNASWEQRFFIVEDASPEVDLKISAQLDDLAAKGSIGFLDVTLGEDSSVNPNNGITFNADVTVNLTDPDHSGRIFVSELKPTNLLDVFDPGITGTVNIDPLILQADVAGSTLGTLKLSLANFKINNAGDLANLPSAILNGIQGNLADFTNFNNITPEMILAALKSLVDRLHDVGGAGGDLVDKPLPLINKSISQLVDLGQALANKLGDLSNVQGSSIFTAKGVQSFLNSKLGANTVNLVLGGGQVRFDFNLHSDISQTLPLAFDLGGQSFISVTGSGDLQLTGSIDLGIGFGLDTGSGLAIEDRIFLDASKSDELKVNATANIGYDLNNDGTPDTTPLNITLSGFGQQFKVVDGRALLTLSLTGDLKDGGNNDGRLTLGEIVSNIGSGSFGNILSANFGGSAQALIPIDGDKNGTVSYPAPPTGGDARIEVAGTLGNLFTGGIDLRTDPTGGADVPHPTNPATPLTPAQFDPTKFVVATHNLTGFITNGFLNFDSWFDGIIKLLEFGDQIFGIHALDFKLPLLGKSPKDVLDFFSSDDPGSLKSMFAQLKSGAGGALGPKTTNAAVYDAADLLRGVLSGISGIQPIGDADRDGVVENNGDDLLSIDRGGSLVSFLVAGGTFASLAPDRFKISKGTENFQRDGVAFNDVVHYISGGAAATGHVVKLDVGSIEVKMDVSGKNPDANSNANVDTHPEIEGVTILAKFQPSFSHTESFNLGVDFLNLQGALDVNLSGNLTVLLGLGFSKNDGFFLKTDFSDVPLSGLTANSPEISLNGRAEVTGSTSLTLGFLDLGATMSTASNGTPLNFLSAGLTANLDGLGDGKLTIPELLNLGNLSGILGLNKPNPGVSLKVQAGLDIQLTTGIDPSLPTLNANLVMHWDDPNNLGHPFDVFKGGVPTPTLAFKHIELNVGSFLNKIAGPIFQQIDKLNVLKPVIDVLDDEIPIIGKTLFEILIEPLSPSEQQAATFLFTLASTVSEAASNASAATAGNLVVAFDDVAILAPPSPGLPVPQGAPPAGVPGENLPIVGGFLHKLGQIGITFPILNVGTLVKLLTGSNVDLAVLNLPKIEAGANFDISFPLFSFGIPLLADVYVEAFVGGGFNFTIDFDAGFDTRGFKSGHLLDGFYIGDFEPGSDGVIKPSDKEKPEIELIAQLHAGVDAKVHLLGLPLAKLTGQGQISADIKIDLNDDDSNGGSIDTRSAADKVDGRLHFDEIQTLLGLYGGNPLCAFDLSGALIATLSLEAKIDLFFFSYHKKIKKDWTLLTFDVNCTPTPPDLANLNGSVLQLTSTAGTNFTSFSGSNDPNGDNVEVDLVDKNQNAQDGLIVLDEPASTVSVTPPASGAFTVTALGPAQWRRRGVVTGQRVRYSSASGPVFGTIASLADDSFTITEDNATTGAPVAGSGFTVFSGKEALRIKKGHAQEDFGPAEPASNNIDVNNITKITDAGGDLGGFGDGDDIVTIDPILRVPVRLNGQGGSDSLTGGSAGATLLGGDGNDVLTLAPAPSDLTPAELVIWNSRMEGGAGDDQITSGPGDDVILGGEGNDSLDGGAAAPRSSSLSNPNGATYQTSGDDTIGGGGGDDIIEGHDGKNTLVGDYFFAFDPLPGSLNNRHEGADIINGGDDNDLIWGDNRDVSFLGNGTPALASRHPDNTIAGNAGNDLIFGGVGNDQIKAGDGNDFVFAGAGNDAIEGGNGDDFLLGENGSDAIVDSSGNDTMLGGWQNDVIRGGPDLNYIEGGPGNDSICGDAGVDTIFGGTAALGLPLLGAAPKQKKHLAAIFNQLGKVLQVSDAITLGGVSEFTCDSAVGIVNVPPELTDDPASVEGQVFLDANGNGVFDAGESGMDGWPIDLLDANGVLITSVQTANFDLNNDGTIDPRTETGVYEFDDLAAGDYQLEIGPTFGGGGGNGFSLTVPLPTGIHQLSLKNGDNAEGINFGVQNIAKQGGSITGTKWLDLNRDGVRDSNEPGVAGITLFIDLDFNGVPGPTEPTVVTKGEDAATSENETGTYEFSHIPAGIYLLREILPAGFIQTFPLFRLVTVKEREVTSGVDFGNAPQPATIRGTKFNDFNRNGVQDAGEGGFSGFTIFLDANNNGQLDVGEQSVVTAFNGAYSFDNIPAGNYIVREVPRLGFDQMAPASGFLSITVTPGQVSTGNNFGNVFGVIRGTPGADEWYVRNNPAQPANVQVFAGSSAAGTQLFELSLAQLNSLRFDALGGNDTLTVDFGFGSPVPAGGIELDGGAGSDTLKGLGTPGVDTILYNSQGMTFNSKPLRVDATVELVQASTLAGNDTGSVSGATTFAPVFLGGVGNDTLFVQGSPGFNVSPSALGTSSLNLVVRLASTVTASSSLQLATLTIQDVSNFKLLPSGGKLLGLTTLTMSPTSKLDLADNEMVVRTTAANQQAIIAVLISLLRTARNTLPPWHGNGITSSTAAQDLIRGIAVMPNIDDLGRPIFASLDGFGLSLNDIILKYTLNGDTDLNGKIDADDYFRTDRGFLSQAGPIPLVGYRNGDFDYTGLVDASDYFLIDSAFLGQTKLPSLPINAAEPEPAAQATETDSEPGIPANPVAGPVAPAADGSVSGLVWNDLDADGVIDANEPGIAGVEIFADLNGNENLDPGEPFAFSATDDPGTPNINETGRYQITNIPAGQVLLREQFFPPHFVPTTPTIQFVNIPSGQDLPNINWGFRHNAGKLSGVKWIDVNKNGIRDAGEKGMAGVLIYLDLNHNNKQESFEPFAITQSDNPATPNVDETGFYEMTEIDAGQYNVEEFVPENFFVGFPASRHYIITMHPDDNLTGLDFGNFVSQQPFVTGTVYNDLNGNGVRDVGEPGIAGVSVFFDFNNNGTIEPGETQRSSESDDPNSFSLDETGRYAFFDIGSGTFNVRDLVPAGFSQTQPGGGFYPVNLTSQPLALGLDFGLAQKNATISGLKWNDVNGNGVKDPLENGVGGITIYLDLNNNGVLDPNEPSTTTTFDSPLSPTIDEGGKYSFTGLVPGTYNVREVLPADFFETFPGTPPNDAQIVHLGTGQNATGINFGNRKLLLLPDGNDTIDAGLADDIVFGDNDPNLPPTVISGGGNDTINGNAGNDTIDAEQANDTVLGGNGNDQLAGGDGDDLILGEAGTDSITGGLGNDTLGGGEGNNTIGGSAGDDTYLFATPAAAKTDVVQEAANAGSDTLDFTTALNVLNMDLNIKLALRTANLTIDLQDGANGDGSGNFENVLGATNAVNTLLGNNAANVLVGGTLADSITGGSGDDSLHGNGGNDTVRGGVGNDLVDGGPGNDALFGFVGDDTFAFFNDWGQDVITESIGNGANDTFDFSGVGDDLSIALDTDVIAVIAGSNSASNTNGEIEHLIGGAGNDSFVFAAGNPIAIASLDGDGGSDTLDYAASTTAVIVDLSAGTATGVPAGIANFENVIGSPTAANTLTGNDSNNKLIGGSAADTFTPNGGDDSMVGNAGNDTYLYTDNFGHDTITELPNGGNDTLDLSAVTRPLIIELGVGFITDDLGNTVTFSNIENVFAGTGLNTLMAQDIPNIWNITGVNSGTLNGVPFVNVQTLIGGSNTDQFIFGPGGQITGSIDGGGGANTLANSNIDTTWNLTAPNTGTATNTVNGTTLFPFTNIQDLTGGDGGNTFILFSGASLSSLTGGAGADALSYANFGSAVTINLLTSTASAVGTIANFNSFVGSTASDTLIGNDNNNGYVISGVNVGNLSGGISFSSIENLTGGLGNDVFRFANAARVTGKLDGGGGSNILNYASYTTAIIVNLQTTSATGTSGIANFQSLVGGGSLNDVLIGENVNNAWNLVGPNAGNIVNANSTFAFTRIENLGGGRARDSFVFNRGSGVTGIISGGAGLDLLDYRQFGAPFSVNLAAGTATNTGGISSIESFIP